ncbi:MAG: DUF1232 domain-containing protein [Peptoniphilaceae bacterium]|nr:DUF1232 domain-containing protein [Peptoniphilaceae bacterium]MDY6085401.1 DUF1232 domain-containing protein [Peptoniphilaceae bacterium]
MAGFFKLFRYGSRAVDAVRHKEKYQDLLKKSVALLQGRAGLHKIREDALLLLNLFKDTVTLKYRGLGKGNVLLIAASFLYLINPMDLIPDFLGVFGFADDISVLSYIINKLSEEIHKYESWKATQGSDGVADDWAELVKDEIQDEPRYTVTKEDTDAFRAAVTEDLEE